jgi:hypothetical protein
VDIDTSPPHIENLAAAVEGDKIHVTFRAVDGYSAIKRAEFSVDAGDWQYVEPVGQLADSKTENYDFNASVRAPEADAPASPSPVKSKKRGGSETAEHVVVVRVYDRFDNMSAAKALIRGK